MQVQKQCTFGTIFLIYNPMHYESEKLFLMHGGAAFIWPLPVQKSK